MARHAYGVLCLAFLLVGIAVEGKAARAIPDDNLAYPVQITLQDCPPPRGGEGSGFFLNADPVQYLVTARHVLFDESSSEFKAGQPPMCKTRLWPL
jgi:S1-C subfamily serine protease